MLVSNPLFSGTSARRRYSQVVAPFTCPGSFLRKSSKGVVPVKVWGGVIATVNVVVFENEACVNLAVGPEALDRGLGRVGGDAVFGEWSRERDSDARGS